MGIGVSIFLIAVGAILRFAVSANTSGIDLQTTGVILMIIGAIGAVAIGLSGWTAGALKPLSQVHPLLLTAGLIGACLVFAIGWLIPQVGAGPLMISMLAGQIFGGMLLSHFGWLGSPVQPVTLTNVLGALLMMGGVFLATSNPAK